MFERFIQWWGVQLIELVPARLKDGTSEAANAVVVEIPASFRAAGPGRAAAPPDVQLWLRRNRQQTSLGHFTLDEAGSASLRLMHRENLPRRSLLRVPLSMLLERDVVLPAAAEPDWRNVLRYEMARLTPFAADAVFWTGAVGQRDAKRGKITLRLSMIPKAALAPVTEALRMAKLDPAAIEIAAPDGMRTISLDAAQSVTWRRNGLRILSGACAGMALLAIVLPFITQARQAAALESKIAALRPVAARAIGLRRRILAGSSSINVIARERLRVGDSLAVLAALTDALPDDTYLTEMRLHRLKLNIAGQSAAAASLLSALSAKPLLKDVTFSAPVTRDSTDHEDLFSIEAVVVPAGSQ